MGLLKPFLLPFMSCARFDFRWALAFLLPPLYTQTVSVYFSWMTWPCIPYLHASFLSIVTSYSFIYVGLLPRSDFQHVGMDHSWIWRLISLKNNCSENIHKFGYKFGESWNCKCCGNRTVFKLGVADFWVKWKYYRNMISFHVCLHTEIERCVLKHKLRESGKARPNFYMKFGLLT